MRTDLRNTDYRSVSYGKVIAQACHASNMSLKCVELHSAADEILLNWNESGVTKIVLKVSSEEELLEIEKQLILRRIPHESIIDNGLTEFAGKQVFTCIGIGPYLPEVINTVTGHLELFDVMDDECGNNIQDMTMRHLNVIEYPDYFDYFDDVKKETTLMSQLEDELASRQNTK